MTISKKSAKAKGKNLQKWMCKKISEFTNIPTSNDDDSLIKSRPMGLNGQDVILIGEARKKFPFGIECKSTECLKLIPFIKQAKANAIDGKWLLVYKNTKINPVIIMDADQFFKTLKEIQCTKANS